MTEESSLKDMHNLSVVELPTSKYDEQLNYDPRTGVKRALKDRHISLLALGGVIGPGCLIGAGNALSKGGPLALLLGFGVVGLVCYAVMESIGELITLYPSGGGFTSLARKFHGDGVSALCGYAYVVVFFAVLANEYNTLSSVMHFWGPQIPTYGYILIFWAFFLAFQMMGVQAFGECEYWLAWFKILGLVVYYLFSIVYMSGGIRGTPAFGFHYWNDPGALSNGFRGIAVVFVFCSSFYSGTESVALAATECRNPRRAVPIAVKQTFWRILIVYMGISVFYGSTVPFDDSRLGSSSKTLKSPVGIALLRAGWPGGVHLVNAFILVTCISAVNSSLFIGSRTLSNLAHEGLAPKILARTNKRGVPTAALLTFNLLGLISLMNVSVGASNAYNYIVNLSGVAVFIVWGIISYTHLRFRKAWRIQGHIPDELPYKSFLYPWLSLISLGANIFLGLIQGWTTLSPFSAVDFVDAYVLLPAGFILYHGVSLLKSGTLKPVDLAEVDLNEGQRLDLDEDLELEEDMRAEGGKSKRHYLDILKAVFQ